MNERLAQPSMITALALATEGGLVALALLIASWWGHNPWGNIVWSRAALEANLLAVGQGALAALPLLLALLVIDRWPPWFLRALKRSVEREVVPLFEQSGLPEFALISLAAGFGEELFFRGLIQLGIAMELHSGTGLEHPQILAISIGVASLIFGVCHWLNREYAIMATITGVYLGVLLVYTDNLLAPITAHALYDFFALCYLVLLKGRSVKPKMSM